MLNLIFLKGTENYFSKRKILAAARLISLKANNLLCLEPFGILEKITIFYQPLSFHNILNNITYLPFEMPSEATWCW